MSQSAPKTTQAQRDEVNARKRKSRKKMGRLGIKPVEVKLSTTERKWLEQGCEIRGGCSGPYEMNEYIATLIRRDQEKLQKQLAKLDTCPHCKQDLPGGCGGLHKGDDRCFHTRQARKLML